MPRIYDADRNPLDYCNTCFKKIRQRYEKDEKADIDAVHPDYDDTDYCCESCGRKLTDKDN